jgi:hypothetical protein
MRLIGFLLAGCIVLAILKVAIQIVVTATLALLLWFGITRPRETCIFLLVLIATGLIAQFPAAGLLTFGCLALVGHRGSDTDHIGQ